MVHFVENIFFAKCHGKRVLQGPCIHTMTGFVLFLPARVHADELEGLPGLGVVEEDGAVEDAEGGVEQQEHEQVVPDQLHHAALPHQNHRPEAPREGKNENRKMWKAEQVRIVIVSKNQSRNKSFFFLPGPYPGSRHKIIVLGGLLASNGKMWTSKRKLKKNGAMGNFLEKI